MWRYSRQMPLCNKCGLDHDFYTHCPAYNQICYSCGKYGHYSRQCLGQFRSLSTNECKTPQNRAVKSKRKQVRNSQRLTVYLERKRGLQEFPFHNVWNSSIMSFFDRTAAIKTEIKSAKHQVQNMKNKMSELQNQLKTKCEEIENLKQEDYLRKETEVNSEKLKCQIQDLQE